MIDSSAFFTDLALWPNGKANQEILGSTSSRVINKDGTVFSFFFFTNHFFVNL